MIRILCSGVNMIHHKPLSSANRKSRLLNQLKIIFLFLVILFLSIKGFYGMAIALVLLGYIINEVFFSDHIFYDVKQDYQYNLQAEYSENILLENNQIIWKKEYANKTLLVEVELCSTFSGYIFDPYIELKTPSDSQLQYFERGLKGGRYINISHINEGSEHESIEVIFHGCRPVNSKAILHGFNKPDLSEKNILVIAPHADDAEIAAFGVYSQNNSFIATITAGELEAEYYESITASKEQASQLKGKLRAWDSISIPLWGGIKADRVIQLGYFCLTLKTMQQKPDQDVQSITAGLDRPSYFRLYNQWELATDETGTASWNNLLADLQEIIKQIQPDVIITAHPEMDPHQDHYYASLAIQEACRKCQLSPDFFLYANHYNHTDIFPFGRTGSLHSLAPEFKPGYLSVSPVSCALDKQMQNNKLMALTMMHDLQIPVPFKKQLRKKLQYWFLGRHKYQMGYDEYFRKAVMRNELFYRVSTKQLNELFIAHQQTGE